jgi:cell wall-associated NlpC family hydrolase
VPNYRIAAFSATVVAIASSFALTNIPSAGASGTSGSSTQTLQARAARISSQISHDSQLIQITAEQFDQANVAYLNDVTKLANIKHQLRIENRNLRSAQIKMKRAVVTAYVYGIGAQAEAEAVLTGHNLTDSNTLTTYASVATSQLHGAVVNLRNAQSAILASEQHQASVTYSAATASSSAQSARTNAQNAQADAKANFANVNGQLAQIIAEQAAARAAAAATAAKAAANALARSQYQAQAQSASTLAQTVAANDTSGSANAAASAALVSSVTANNVGAPNVILGPSTSAGNAAVAAAVALLGIPYVWGGASSSVGFDCSGLTMVAWQAAGVSLTHSAYDQYLHTSPIPIVNNTITLEPGDLLYYFFPDDGGQPVTHVVMYVGSGPYGTNTVIVAPTTGENVMYQQIYWGGYVGAGRP